MSFLLYKYFFRQVVISSNNCKRDDLSFSMDSGWIYVLRFLCNQRESFGIVPRNANLYLRKSGDCARIHKCFSYGRNDTFIIFPCRTERFTRLLICSFLSRAFPYPLLKTYTDPHSQKRHVFFFYHVSTHSCFSFEAIKLCHLENVEY